MDEDFSKDIRHHGKTKDEIIKEIQKLLLHNDFSVASVFTITKHMKKYLHTNIEWTIASNRVKDEDKKLILKEEWK